MLTTLTARQKAALYYLIAFGLAVTAAETVPSIEGAAMLGMITPLAAVLIMMLVVTPDGRRRTAWASLGLRRIAWRWWPLAIVVPAVLLVLSFGAAWVADFLDLNLGAMAPTDILTGLVITIVLGLGEEIGWRGYLLPLIRRDNPRSGAAIVGFLHGLWHLPVFLLTGYIATIPGSPIVIVPVFLVTLTAAGVVYAWIRDRSGSIWPVVVMHQTFNSVSDAFTAGAVVTAPVAVTYTAGETGIVTMLLVVALAVLLGRSKNAQLLGRAGQRDVQVVGAPGRAGHHAVRVDHDDAVELESLRLRHAEQDGRLGQVGHLANDK